MDKLTIIRKRLIPDEEVDISGDELISFDGKTLVTRWLPIKPRPDIGWGQSVTDLEQGVKVSAVFDREGDFRHWYWDVVKADFDEDCRRLVIKDMLLDVVVKPDMTFSVLDEDELERALGEGMLTEAEAQETRQKAARVIELVKSGDFPLKEAAEGSLTPPERFVKEYFKRCNDMLSESWKKLQNGSDIRGVALEGVEGQHVNLTAEKVKLLAKVNYKISIIDSITP